MPCETASFVGFFVSIPSYIHSYPSHPVHPQQHCNFSVAYLLDKAALVTLFWLLSCALDVGEPAEWSHLVVASSGKKGTR